jgi:hypothetical protein
LEGKRTRVNGCKSGEHEGRRKKVSSLVDNKNAIFHFRSQ